MIGLGRLSQTLTANRRALARDAGVARNSGNAAELWAAALWVSIRAGRPKSYDVAVEHELIQQQHEHPGNNELPRFEVLAFEAEQDHAGEKCQHHPLSGFHRDLPSLTIENAPRKRGEQVSGARREHRPATPDCDGGKRWGAGQVPFTACNAVVGCP